MSFDALFQSDIREYVLDVSLRENSIAEELYQYTLDHVDQSQFLTAPEQAQFLAFLVRLMKVQKIIEVGVYTGYSSLVMAQALPDDGVLFACDRNQEWLRHGEGFWQRAGVRERIRVCLGDAKESLKNLHETLGDASVDLMFIDADKIHYRDYYQWALRLVRPGGLIVFDNVLWVGSLVSDCKNPTTRAVHALNVSLQSDDRVDISLLPIGKGMLLAHKRGV